MGYYLRLQIGVFLILMIAAGLAATANENPPAAQRSTVDEHVKLADGLMDKGDVDGAIAEYHAAIRLNPDNSDASNLSFVFWRKSQVSRTGEPGNEREDSRIRAAAGADRACIRVQARRFGRKNR
jgi:hypothetical protein